MYCSPNGKARDFYEKAKQEQKQGRFFPERYQHGGYELVQELIDNYLRTSTAKRDQEGNCYFARWWGQRFEGRRLSAITPAALEQARQDLLSKGLTPQTVNRYMAWIRHLLNVAVRDGKLQHNPMSTLKMFKEPKGRVRFLTPDEEASLMTTLGSKYASWARLAILTGMRQAE